MRRRNDGLVFGDEPVAALTRLINALDDARAILVAAHPGIDVDDALDDDALDDDDPLVWAAVGIAAQAVELTDVAMRYIDGTRRRDRYATTAGGSSKRRDPR